MSWEADGGGQLGGRMRSWERRTRRLLTPAVHSAARGKIKVSPAATSPWGRPKRSDLRYCIFAIDRRIDVCACVCWCALGCARALCACLHSPVQKSCDVICVIVSFSPGWMDGCLSVTATGYLQAISVPFQCQSVSRFNTVRDLLSKYFHSLTDTDKKYLFSQRELFYNFVALIKVALEMFFCFSVLVGRSQVM